jgi:hypothetical protein
MFFKRKKLPYYIFQIGFNRCGTSSISHFFNKNGYKAAHWEKGTIAVGMELARLRDEPLLTYCKEYDVYTDLEKVNLWRLPKLKWRYPIFRKYLKETDQTPVNAPPIYAFKYFKKLEKQYPNSRFIFNTRDRDNWIQSRLNLNQDKESRITYRSCTCGDDVHHTETALVQCWKDEWDRHHDNVLSYFDDKPKKLLHFNINHDGADKLMHFFSDLDLNRKNWAKRNATQIARS